VAHKLSRAVERSEQRTRELSELEQLGRAILVCCPDASDLPEVLRDHVPNMFPYSQIEIRADRGPNYPDQNLLRHPGEITPVVDLAWEWLYEKGEASTFLPGASLPWQEQPTRDALVMAPILDVEHRAPIGGIYLSRSRDPDSVSSLLPAVQSLGAQIASALHGAETYIQTLAHQRVEQELALAAEIQTSFLPDDIPRLPGWQIAATLKPARETSGDFYDFIPLPDGKIGMLIADVADKGMGAALYMAFSRTLIRSCAIECCTQPDQALSTANRRILEDARADMFVTVFHGILDPTTGILVYCNAGHNPPYLIKVSSLDGFQALHRTGMALGVIEDAEWERDTVQMANGDVLVLYTDGVSDAQDEGGEIFGEERLQGVLQANRERSAQDILDTTMSQVNEYVGDAPQFDDTTLMVLVRDSTTEEIP
jgi:serine phosphatase RsbU (regulator of sigma subunit)